MQISYNEFHISRTIRDLCDFDGGLFASSGNVIFANMKNVRVFQDKLNAVFDERGQSEKRVSAGQLNAMGLIDEIFHYVCMLYRQNKAPSFATGLIAEIETAIGKENLDTLLLEFMAEFPPVDVYQGKLSAEEYLSQTAIDVGTGLERPNREQTLEEFIMLVLANENPAFKPFKILFDDEKLKINLNYDKVWAVIKTYAKSQPLFGPFDHDLITLFKEPVLFSPESLKEQLEYIQKHWGKFLGEWLKRILAGMDTISEEEKAMWHPIGDGAGPDMIPPSYEDLMHEYERYSPDKDWMPKVVLMAKTVLVWLDQLTKKYGYPITRLDQIPDAELDTLRDEGFTGLWLIGLWERSNASKRIKQICGNPEAAASAYSLYDYNIAQNIGGWDALANLRQRLWQRGIRLASDMVPNHTGMDSDWVMNKPDLFIQRRDCPFPHYTFNGENLSHDSRTSVYLEDHYYAKNDCAVVFKRVDNATGDVRYIYHGNDGTGLPWNDTAQIDFLNPKAREEVIQEILHVARNFPIIRFDAAMVLAKKHIRRLWYPEPGHGGDIATRSETGLSTDQFNDAIPNEFWREVVDRVAQEVPDTLLLAEAFWMMEGYFVRTLGMHRVYNSAFMNMLKKEENQKYRDTIKNTIKFDPQVLKRYVNFMNNPDEETAVAQFGKGDKYFGVCTLMVTMPGLPMFGHGQIEGFEEKYGMEYTKAYRDETPDGWLIGRHWHDIFPLMKKRYLFAGVEHFLLYSLWDNGHVNENVFAYSNGAGNERTLVFYNNKYERASGWIKQSEPYAVKIGSGENDIQEVTRSISEGLNLNAEDDKFMIFREHRTGLWYIRKSREICEKGMYVALNGFEYQVYLDIHQVADLPDGRYRILCEALNGKGCEDIEIAWQEILYKEIYDAFSVFANGPAGELFTKLSGPAGVSGLITDEILNALKEDDFVLTPYEKKAKKSAATKAKVSDKIDAKEIANILEESEKSAVAFYKAINKYLDKGDEKFDTEKAYKTFCSRVKEIVKVVNDTKSNKNPKTKSGAGKMNANQNIEADAENTTYSANAEVGETEKIDIVKALLKIKDADKFIKLATGEFDLIPSLISFAMASTIAESSYAVRFALPRKFNEKLRAIQESEFDKILVAKAKVGKGNINERPALKDFRNTITKMFVLSAKTDLKLIAKDEKKAAYAIVHEMMSGDYAYVLSGANVFDNVKWFNKEASDESVALWAVAALMNAKAAQVENVFKMYKTLCAAKTKAAYKAELFEKAFAPKGEVKGKTSKVKSGVSGKPDSVKKTTTKGKPTVKKETATKTKTTAKKPTTKTTTPKKKSK